MQSLTYLYIFVVTLSLMIVLAGLRWSRSGFGRALILGLFVLLLPAAYAAPASLLGQAKPVTLEWLGQQVEEAAILSATMIEGDAIFLTLLWHREPGLYRLPWDRDMAEQLQDAMREAQRNGTNPVMRLPFEPSWDRNEPRFYALPQRKLPDKPIAEPPEEFAAPSQGI